MKNRCTNPRTSQRVQRAARRILRDPTSSPMAKSLAAAALTRAPNKPSKKALAIVAKEAKAVLARVG